MKQSTIIGIIVVVVVIIIAGVYVGTQMGGNNNASVGEHPVAISDFAFTPNIIVVHVGETVTWKNNDAVIHTVTSDANSTRVFDSGNMAAGSTFAVTFTAVGDYWYHCTPHPSMAHAIVRVTPDVN